MIKRSKKTQLDVSKKKNSVGTRKVNHKGKEYVTYKVRSFHAKTVSIFTQNIKVRSNN